MHINPLLADVLAILACGSFDVDTATRNVAVDNVETAGLAATPNTLTHLSRTSPEDNALVTASSEECLTPEIHGIGCDAARFLWMQPIDSLPLPERDEVLMASSGAPSHVYQHRPWIRSRRRFRSFVGLPVLHHSRDGGTVTGRRAEDLNILNRQANSLTLRTGTFS